LNEVEKPVAPLRVARLQCPLEIDMPRVLHFEIPAENPENAMAFYGNVFGWTFDKWDGPQEYWMIGTGDGPGIDGGLMRKNPGQPMTNVISVPHIDEYVSKVESAGGTIVVPKMTLPGVGYLAYFQDLDDNILGIMQVDHSATA
jgi:uncharacterized protein